MQITLGELAKLLNAELVGNENATVHTVAKIEEGFEGALSFLANPKYEQFIYTTKSTVVLVNKSFVAEKNVLTNLLKVDDAYAAFTFLLEKFSNKTNQLAGIENGSFVSDNAKVGNNTFIGFGSYIGDDAEIGESTKILQQVFIGSNVKIGSNCLIFPGVKIYHDCIIGDNVIIHSGTVIGSDGFGFAPLPNRSYKKIPQTGNVIIKNNVEIGANCAIDRATMGSTIIHEGVKIDNLVHLAHNVEIDEHTVIAGQTGVAGSTKIGKYCIAGGQVGFAGHITIADGSQFGAQSGINSSIKEPEKKWNGSPVMPLQESLKMITIYRKLPELLKRIESLEKQLAQAKNNIGN
ncbi:MAG: UDP-3-O-(3-hydroxymyristoyl)glucosamine N-acyltransferase [Bacteroidia bacterium]